MNRKQYILGAFLLVGISGPSLAGTLTTEGRGELLTLAECITIAEEKSPDLAYSRYDIEAKTASLASARKDYYPSLTAKYGYTKQPDVARSPENSFSYTIAAEQPVYRGEALDTAVAINELNVRSAQIDLTRNRNDLLRLVHAAYYDILKTEKLEEEARQAVLRMESHLKDAEAFYAAGLIPKNDLLQSQVQLAQGRQNLLKAENANLMAKSKLNVMLKRPAEQSFQVEDVLVHLPWQPVWQDILAKAMTNRPEVAQSTVNVEKAEKNITMVKAPFLPSVTVSANYQHLGDDPSVHVYDEGPREARTVMAVAQWNFWSWGQKDDAVLAASRDLSKVKESATKVTDSITLEVRQAYLNLLQSEKNIDVTQQAVSQAEENYRINEARYQAQLNTSTDVLDAQSLLTSAKTNYFTALYDYNMAMITVKWSSGILDENSGQQQ